MFCSHCNLQFLEGYEGRWIHSLFVSFLPLPWKISSFLREEDCVRKRRQRQDLPLTGALIAFSAPESRRKISPSWHRHGLCSDRHWCCRTCSQTGIIGLGNKWILWPGILISESQSCKKPQALCTPFLNLSFPSTLLPRSLSTMVVCLLPFI